MRLKKGTTICGLDVEGLRGFFRELTRRDSTFTANLLAEVFSLDKQGVAKALRDLEAEGYIVPVESRGLIRYYGPTMKAGGVAQAHFGPGFSREVAQRAIDGFLERIAIVNASPDYMVTIRHAYIFGSFVNSDSPTVGDVDIAIDDVERRPPPGHTRVTYGDMIARRHNLRGEFPWARAGLSLTSKALKAKSPVLSIHPFDDAAFVASFPDRAVEIFALDGAPSAATCIENHIARSRGIFNCYDEPMKLT
jgi:hypothetical protein